MCAVVVQVWWQLCARVLGRVERHAVSKESREGEIDVEHSANMPPLRQHGEQWSHQVSYAYAQLPQSS